MHKILQWKQATMLRNRCIWSRTRSQLIAHRKWHKLPKRCDTRQQHTTAHYICKQKSIQCWEEIQQYRKGSIRNITWTGEILSLLLCERGKCNYRPKLLVVIFKKYVGTLLQRLQWILLRIHQYRANIIYNLT